MSPTLQVTLIAAVSEDGFISRGSGVPWDLPKDKAHFRAQTAGKWLLLGRRTYLEMTGWFRDHHPLVLSQDSSFQPSVGERVATVDEALAKATSAGVGELVVIGGGQAYAAAMAHATRLDLTLVQTKLGAGISFPIIDPAQWRQVSSSEHSGDESHAYAFTFTEWLRVGPNASEV